MGIHQPNFVPWLGYFLKISLSDYFVILDDVQFSRSRAARADFMKKNLEKIQLSIPVHLKNGFRTSYKEAIPVSENRWRKKLLFQLKENYSQTPHYHQLVDKIEETIMINNTNLSEFNLNFINLFCKLINVRSKIIFSSDLDIQCENANQRNLNLVRKLNGTIYWSGAGAAAYNHPAAFEKHNISFRYATFNHEQLKFIPENEKHCSLLHHLFKYGPAIVQDEIEQLKAKIEQNYE